MDYSREWWVRLYTSESNQDRARPLLARGLRDTLLRYAEPIGKGGKPTPRSGELMRGKSPEHVIEQLVNAMGTHPSERELVAEFLELWIDDGWLTLRHEGRKKRWYVLCIKNYVDAQTARTKAAERMRRFRQRQQEAKQKPPTKTVTRDATSDAPVAPPVPSPSGNGSVRKRERERERERGSNIRGGDVTRDVTRDASDLDYDDREEQVCELAAAYLQNPVEVGQEHGPPHTWPPVVSIFEAHNRAWSRRDRPVNSGDRGVQMLLARLSEGFVPSELIRAVEGARHDEFYASNRHLQSLAALLKHPDRIETFRQLADNPPAPLAADQQPEEGYETGWTKKGSTSSIPSGDEPGAKALAR